VGSSGRRASSIARQILDVRLGSTHPSVGRRDANTLARRIRGECAPGLCECVCMCTCTCTRKRTSSSCIHRYMHSLVHMPLHIHMHVHLRMYSHVHVYVHTYTCTGPRTRSCPRTRTCPCFYIYACTCACPYARSRPCTYSCHLPTHMQLHYRTLMLVFMYLRRSTRSQSLGAPILCNNGRAEVDRQ